MMESKKITLRSQTVKCPYCGEYYSVTYKYCPFCDAAHAMMWSSILVTAIYGAILYGITLYMLRKRLNLE